MLFKVKDIYLHVMMNITVYTSAYLLSLSLERKAMHVKLGELKKTKFRRIQEIHIQNLLLLFSNLLIC